MTVIRIAVAGLATAAVLVFASCGGGTTTIVQNTTTASPPQTQTVTEKTVTTTAKAPSKSTTSSSPPPSSTTSSSSPASATPPDVVGEKLPQAEAELKAAGYKVHTRNTDTAFGIIVPTHYTICTQSEPEGDRVTVLAQKYGC